MSEVKRYRHFPAQYARMFIDTLPSGEYVTGADYDALSADNKRLREALELSVEGAQILQTLIDNVESRGNYSAESTVGFLQQAIGYLLPARAALAGSKEGE